MATQGIAAKLPASTVSTRHAPIKGEIPWRERPFLTLQVASELACVSIASIYRLGAEGRLTLKRIRNRTVVETEGVIALVETAEDWTPSDRPRAAIEKRVERAREAWQD